MNKLNGKENAGYLKDLLAVGVVITGKKEDGKLTGKISSEGNTVAFVPVEDEIDFLEGNFTFKNMQPAINFAQQHGYNLVMGVDVGSCKLSLAVRKNPKGAFQLLNVHQLAVLLTSVWISEYQAENLVIVKSAQITEMVDKIADINRITYISKVIEPGKLVETVEEIKNNGNNHVVVGLSESQQFYDCQKGFGAIVGNLLEMEKQLFKNDKTLFDKLLELYELHGFYREKMFTVEFRDDSQKAHMLKKMEEIRKNPAFIQEKLKAIKMIDYKKGISKNLISENITPLDSSGFNILKISMENGKSVTFAPSEDKMYYFVGMKEVFRDKESLSDANRNFDEQAVRIMQIINKL